MGCFKPKHTETKPKAKRTIYTPSEEVESQRITIDQVTLTENGASGSDAFEAEYSREIAQTEQVLHAESEHRQTLLITGVIHPVTKKEISLRNALDEGIVNQEQGTYNNPRTGESVSIPEAINSGQIKVEMVQTDVVAERRRELGIITIKTTKETRPFRIEKVIDAKTDKTISLEAAIKKGIVDQERGVYLDTETKQEIGIPDAIDCGRIIVSFEEQEITEEPEVVSKTYAIRSVVDQETRERVPFSVAVDMGLIDPDTGAYHNKKTGETIYASEAISRGLLKATVVTDRQAAAGEVEQHVQELAKLKGVRTKIMANSKALAAFQSQKKIVEQRRVKVGKRFLYY